MRPVGNTYAPAGPTRIVAAANGIIHIDHAGSSGSATITSVNGVPGSNLASAVRGMLFDAIGTFGNDMLVTTSGGPIYRVDSTGAATLLASVGEERKAWTSRRSGPSDPMRVN